ncbi:MAG TPA: TIGR03086 family metal-binding protein [Acidimicrobiia bacterium]|nr:TIGR03086 family metal-binding protein [Acidimicrobiia bacterium]
MDALGAYEQTLVWTGQRVAGVRGDNLDAVTPCRDWTVRALVAHIVAGIWYFKALAAGEGLDQLQRELSDLIGDDPFASYDRAARSALDAWRGTGALDRTCSMPLGDRPGRDVLAIHQADLLIHGWDVAEATHQDAAIPGDLAEFALGTERSFIQAEMRGPGRAYAEIRTDSEITGPQDRLLAFVGRSSAWRGV